MTDTTKPAGFEDDVSEYQAVSFDSYSGQPVSWGHKILRHLGDVRFGELRSKHKVDVTERGYNCVWSVIKDNLTLEKAIELYGPVTKLVVGPRGGSRTIQFTKSLKEVDPKYEHSTAPIKFFSSNIEGDFDAIPENLIEVER